MRAEAENASDDHVLRAGVRPSAYAGTLVALNEVPSRRFLPQFGAVGMAGARQLEERVRAIVSPSRDCSHPNVLAVAAAVSALAIVVPLTAIERLAAVPAPASRRTVPGGFLELVGKGRGTRRFRAGGDAMRRKDGRIRWSSIRNTRKRHRPGHLCRARRPSVLRRYGRSGG